VAIRRRDLGPPTGVVAAFLDVLAEDVVDRKRTLTDS
jgi:hypothetical protein